MSNNKKKFGYAELLKHLAIVWLSVLTIILAFAYVNTSSSAVWKDTAFPWLVAGVISTIIGLVFVQIDKR